MSKKTTRSLWFCRECGSEHVKWQGQCRVCGSWNSLVEEPTGNLFQPASDLGRPVPIPLQDIDTAAESRLPLPDPELNRVLGGGLVEGSLILLGGEPGIGKSTLLLQLALALKGRRVLYVSGEESERQLRLRAERLPQLNDQVLVYAETQLEAVLAAALDLKPDLLCIDSIQTLSTAEVKAAPGSPSQVRECTLGLLRLAKGQSLPVVLVGHITKEGLIAGPKLLEHMVDVVLEFEGDRRYDYRLVRSQKNRFGSTPEIGVYEMRAEGLRPVVNPSELFLPSGDSAFAGVAVAATQEGTRPFLVEVQALVTPTSYVVAQRSSTGFDSGRLHMLVAVLEKKCNFRLADQDVFLNVAGGLHIDDPAVDLAVACALASSFLEEPIPPDMAFAGEVGLTGEVRSVGRVDARVAETARLGFKHLVVAERQLAEREPPAGLTLMGFGQLVEVFKFLFGPGAQRG